MTRGRNSFKMGTVELIVLFLLSKQDLYGYQISALIKDRSQGKVLVAESTLYPTLYKLLNKDYISAREAPIGKRRMRVYYHLEEAGRQRLDDLLEDYEEIMSGIAAILKNDKLVEEIEF